MFEEHHPEMYAQRMAQLEAQRHVPPLERLLDVLIASPDMTDVEIAKELHVELEPLRERLTDLERRGIVVAPTQTSLDAPGWIWHSWFGTTQEAMAMAARSGLEPEARATLRPSFWRKLRYWNEPPVLVRSSFPPPMMDKEASPHDLH